MKKEFIIPIIILAAVILSVCLWEIFSNPTQVKWTLQVLVVLTVAVISISSSLMFAASKNEQAIVNARREETEKWLPAAESAYKGLMNIQYALGVLKENHGGWCKDLPSVFPSIEKTSMKGMKKYVGGKCENVMQKLDAVDINLASAMSNWDAYISQNCTDEQCTLIYKRINELGVDYLGWELEAEDSKKVIAKSS